MYKSHYENVPFEIPEFWCWTTIDELLINRDSERVPLSSTIRKKQVNKVYDYYGAAGVIDKVEGYLFNEKLLLIGEDGANLLSRSKDNAFFADGKYWVNNHAHVLDCCYKSILTYVAYLINSISLEPYVTGTAQPKLSQDNLNKIPIALPPIKEQARIVAGIEKWGGFIDEIEAGKIELESYIKQTKSKILDLAISGKLVPQDPNDEPAIELLKRINPDFEPCDNSHYENLPQGWTVCKIKDIFNITMGQSPTGESINGVKGIEFHQGKIHFTESYLSQSGVYTDQPTKIAEVDSLLLCVRAPVGVLNITQRKICIGRGLCALKPKYEIDNLYWLFILTAYKDYFESNATGSTFKAISGDTIKNAVIKLPPLQEQKRILSSIISLYESLDAITAEL